MKTSKRRFSRQKHAHKQRKKGLSCHHAPPLYNHSSLSEEVWIHGCGTLRCGQAPSGALRCTQVLSETLCFNLDSTVLRATGTLHCFNGLQQPQRPSRPQAPKEPQRPQGWMLSFDSHPPIPQLFVKNLFLCTAHKIPMSESVETVALVAIVTFVLGIHCDYAHLAHQTHHHDDAHNRYKSPTITLYYEIRCKITFFRNGWCVWRLNGTSILSCKLIFTRLVCMEFTAK